MRPCLRMTLVALTALVAGSFLNGCTVDVTPTLPPLETNFAFPLPPGVPILTDLFLPSINTCEAFDQDTLNNEISNGNPFLSFLTGLITIQEVSLVRAEMEAIAPENATWDGMTEVSFRENDQPLIIATAADGISGKFIILDTDNPVNLVDIVDQCPERESEISLRVRGAVPLNGPTTWRTKLTVHLVAKIGFF